MFRGVYWANSSAEGPYGWGRTVKLYGHDLHAFHTYGIEWDEKQMLFFFNDRYSLPLEFNGRYLKS